MTKMMSKIVLATLLLAFLTVGLSAQDVMMNSAETIDVGNLKLAVFPTVLFAKGGDSARWGVAGRFGYGFTPRFDIEAKGAIFRGIKYFGGDAELWLVHGGRFNVSAAVGGHITDSVVEGDSSGFDASLLISHAPPGLELYIGFKAAFDFFQNTDRSATRVHLVPGFEYGLSEDLDFLTEVGIGLNNSSRSYFSIGFAFYFLD